jgi:peptidoglycan/LPS O-acetylase OafA/YrhL
MEGKTQKSMPLTATRGLAAFLVVMLHETSLIVNQNIIVKKLGLFRWFLAPFIRGEIGVGILIFLSGYLLIPKFSENPQNYKNFFLRRFSRIYPTYIFILITAISLTHQWDFNGFINAVLLLPNLPGTLWPYPYLSSAWSLGIEWFLYLTIPIIALGVIKKARSIISWFILILFFMLIGRLSGLDMHSIVYGSFLGRLIEFAAGGYFALNKDSYLDLKTNFRMVVNSALIGSVWAWSMWYMNAGGAISNSYLRFAQPLVEIAASILTIQLFTWLYGNVTKTKAQRVLLNPLHFLGQISYPLYLIHITCIVSVKRIFEMNHIALHAWSILGIGSISFGLSISVAYMLHTVIELPGMRIGRQGY